LIRSRLAFEQPEIRRRVPSGFASRLAHERYTPSCLATAATVMPASNAPAMM
jgi:hypothetical protein